MPPGTAPFYKRVLLKLSGEALMAPGGQAISPEILGAVADEVVATCKLGCELALVLGGGNIFRGVSTQARGMERSTADYVGMLATVMNAVAMQDALEARGLTTRVQSAINMPQLAEPFIRRRAVRHLEKGRVVIFAAGTGNPYFTTDTAAALRAMEIHADVLLKATSVDGVYDKDPKKHTDAVKYERVTYMDCLQKNLKVMDMTAFALCRDNKLPMIIFDMMTAGNVQRVVKGEKVGTIVVPEDEKSK